MSVLSQTKLKVSHRFVVIIRAVNDDRGVFKIVGRSRGSYLPLERAAVPWIGRSIFAGIKAFNEIVKHHHKPYTQEESSYG